MCPNGQKVIHNEVCQNGTRDRSRRMSSKKEVGPGQTHQNPGPTRWKIILF